MIRRVPPHTDEDRAGTIAAVPLPGPAGDKPALTEAAAERLVSEALEQQQAVGELCAARFKDFHFGLKLITQNSGQKEFVIDRDAVEAPDKVLSAWVVASYRTGENQPGGS